VEKVDKVKKWGYNKCAKPIEYCKTGIIFLTGKYIFFSARRKIEFDKMQIPLCLYGYARFAKDWFGDYRSLRFCAPASVGALFYFILFFRRKK
jgi:hypothetical protein